MYFLTRFLGGAQVFGGVLFILWVMPGLLLFVLCHLRSSEQGVTAVVVESLGFGASRQLPLAGY